MLIHVPKAGFLHERKIRDDIPKPTLVLVPLGANRILDLVAGTVISTNARNIYFLGKLAMQASVNLTADATTPSADPDVAPISAVYGICGPASPTGGSIFAARGASGINQGVQTDTGLVVCVLNSTTGLVYSGTVTTAVQPYIAGVAASNGDTAQIAYANGSNIARTAVAHGYNTSTTARFSCGSSATSTIFGYIVAMWHATGIGEALCAELSSDPESLLMQRRVYMPFTAAAASVPTLSASTYVAGSLTSTGWRPQVTAS